MASAARSAPAGVTVPGGARVYGAASAPPQLCVCGGLPLHEAKRAGCHVASIRHAGGGHEVSGPVVERMVVAAVSIS